jgi:hypothetical protein
MASHESSSEMSQCPVCEALLPIEVIEDHVISCLDDRPALAQSSFSSSSAATSSESVIQIPLIDSLVPLFELHCCGRRVFCKSEPAICPTCGRLFPVYHADEHKEPVSDLSAEDFAHFRDVPFGRPAPRCIVIKTTRKFDEFVSCLHVTYLCTADS